MRNLLSSLVLFVLIGCGESSSSTDSVRFAGQEIEGLKKVKNGEKVSFYVGDILLATVKSHANMTLFDLAEITAPIKAKDIKKSLKENSLNKVKNLALFLQTIDRDGDASNGIEIPKELDALTKDVSLDFNASSYMFPHSFALRKFMAEGRKEGIWESDRHIVKPYVALDALYTSLNLKPEIFVAKREHYLYQLNDSNDTSIKFDDNGNTYVSKIDRRKKFEFNSKGQLKSILEDSNNNVNTDFKTIYSYDKYGNETLKESYINKNVTIYFDGDNNIFYDYNDDNGTLVKYKQEEKTYNFNNDLLLHQNKDVLYKIFFDTNTSYSYDEFGNRISYYKYLNKYEQYCTDFTFNSLGLVTLEENDFNCDNTINSIRKNIYDAKKRLIETSSDYDADGLIDSNSSVVFYDGERKQTFITYNDGIVTSQRVDIYVDIYNGHNNIIYRSHESDGRVYDEDNITYIHSDTGKVLREEVHNKEGVLSETTVTSYDNFDNVLMTECKDILNDIVTYRASYTYDKNGYILTSDVFQYGYDEYKEAFTYDTFGNELTYQKITKQDGDTIKVEIHKEYINTSKWVSLGFLRKKRYIFGRF